MSVPVEKAELIFTKERCLVSSFPTARHCPSSMNPPLWEIDTQSCLEVGYGLDDTPYAQTLLSLPP